MGKVYRELREGRGIPSGGVAGWLLEIGMREVWTRCKGAALIWSAAGELQLLRGEVPCVVRSGENACTVKAGAGLPHSTGERWLKRGSGIAGALEDGGGFAVIGGAEGFAKAAFLGDFDGGEIIGTDEADGAGIGEARVAPGQGGTDGFGGVALAVHGGSENPAGFAEIFDGRGEFAIEVGEAHFAGEGAGGFFFEDPKTETEKRPVSGVAQEFDPSFFGGERAAADELGHGGVSPHFAASGEIFEAMAAKAKALRFDDGEFGGERQRFKHGEILAQARANIGMEKSKEGVVRGGGEEVESARIRLKDD